MLARLSKLPILNLAKKKSLAAIYKDKIGLADQSLPNASRMLFGDDFPTKQADLSRGLAKNLALSSRPGKRIHLPRA